jgi:hypothetical protein
MQKSNLCLSSDNSLQCDLSFSWIWLNSYQYKRIRLNIVVTFFHLFMILRLLIQFLIWKFQKFKLRKFQILLHIAPILLIIFHPSSLLPWTVCIRTHHLSRRILWQRLIHLYYLLHSISDYVAE